MVWTVELRSVSYHIDQGVLNICFILFMENVDEKCRSPFITVIIGPT